MNNDRGAEAVGLTLDAQKAAMGVIYYGVTAVAVGVVGVVLVKGAVAAAAAGATVKAVALGVGAAVAVNSACKRTYWSASLAAAAVKLSKLADQIEEKSA